MRKKADAVKKSHVLGIVVALGLAVAAFWVHRDQEASQCREAATRAGALDYGFSDPRITAAMDAGRDLNRRKVADCYRRGLVATPQG